MRDLIRKRREEIELLDVSARDDIPSLLINASQEKKYSMSDSELMSVAIPGHGTP